MKNAAYAGILLLAFAAHVQGQLENAGEETQSKCRSYMQTPLPADQLANISPKVWPECNSYKLEAGIGVAPNFEEAWKCAWVERKAIESNLKPRYKIASVLGGSAMLTTLYANGEGVERNIPLALRFACEAGGAPAEISIRVEHLETLRAKPDATASKFNFCDDITSGFIQGFCAAYESEFSEQARIASMHEIEARLSPFQRGAFAELVKEEAQYAYAHAKGEIDLSGTARAMYQIDSEDTLKEDFLSAVRSFESGKLPTGSAQAYREADARLNAVYRKALANAQMRMKEYGAVQPEGIRNAERAWLKYRDSWVAFAKLRYPSVSPEVWLMQLTEDRTSILDGKFCEMDAEEGPCVQESATWKPSPLL